MRPVGLLVSVLALLASHLPAHAFVRQTDEQTGVEVFWSTRRVPVRPAFDSSSELTDAQFMETTLTAAGAWSAAGGCTDMVVVVGAAPSSLETNGQGAPSDGENRIVWREAEWISNDPSVLALTTIRYDRETGTITDADIDVNGVDFIWSAEEVPAAGESDALNMLTHEMGHLLGFAHTSIPEATMFARSDAGDVEKRDLAEDDIAAVCSVYPAGLPTPSNSPLRGGLSGQFTCTPFRADGGPFGFVVLLIALVLVRRRS